jgi:hypothetical protein
MLKSLADADEIDEIFTQVTTNTTHRIDFHLYQTHSPPPTPPLSLP